MSSLTRLPGIFTRPSRQRPWHHVPSAVLWATPALLVAAHLLAPGSGVVPLTRVPPVNQAAAETPVLPAPPSTGALRALALGDPVALSRFISLWLQSRESTPAGPVPMKSLDYETLFAWMDRCMALDPSRDDLLALAARVYAEVPDAARQRVAIDFVRRHAQAAPARRWPYLAHVTVLARHRLDDLALARELARELRERTRPGEIPAWAREMELTVLRAQGEWQAARELVGALLVEGGPREAGELRFLERYLQSLPQPGAARP